ncbi:MAG: hypothetical protein V7606_1138 [Burkholderiales bacterium]|jgi:hypothetical protein
MDVLPARRNMCIGAIPIPKYTFGCFFMHLQTTLSTPLCSKQKSFIEHSRIRKACLLTFTISKRRAI